MLMSFVHNSKIVDYSCSYIMLMSWNLLPFSANLISGKKKKSHDARYGKHGGCSVMVQKSISSVSISRSFSRHIFPDMSQDDCVEILFQCVPVYSLCVSVVDEHPKCSKFLTRYTPHVVLFIIIDSRTVHKYNHPSCRLLHFWTLTTNHCLPFCSLFPPKMKFYHLKGFHSSFA